MSVTITARANVRVPMVPNWLRYGDGDEQVLSVADVPDDDLRALAKAWGEELVAHAARIRKGRKP